MRAARENGILSGTLGGVREAPLLHYRKAEDVPV